MVYFDTVYSSLTVHFYAIYSSCTLYFYTVYSSLLCGMNRQDSEEEEAPVPAKGKDKKEGGKDAFERHFQVCTGVPRS